MNVSESRRNGTELVIAIEICRCSYGFSLNNHICKGNGVIRLRIIDTASNNALCIELTSSCNNEKRHPRQQSKIPIHDFTTTYGWNPFNDALKKTET